MSVRFLVAGAVGIVAMSVCRDDDTLFVNLLTSVINDSSVSILFTIIATFSISCIVRICSVF